MRIVTWNLWWQFGPWRARQPAIAAELRRLDPDVALLQEVWADDDHDQAEILTAELGSVSGPRHMVRTVRPSGEPQRFGNAIISRWPIISSEMITLSGDDGKPSHRSALAAVLDTQWGPWLVTVTHLAWQYDAGPLRMSQLGEVVDLIQRQQAALQPPEADDEGSGGKPGDAPSGPPPVLGGDLNSVPESDEIRRLTGLSTPYQPGLIFTDVWAAVGDGDGHTWTRDNPHAADALWPRRRLDYVMVAWPRGKPLGNPLGAELAGVEPVDQIVPSDHYAVVVELDQRQTLDHD